MDKEEMKAVLEARGLWESSYDYLVRWQLAEKVEVAMDAGVPTLDEVKELEEMDKPKEKPKEKPKAKPKAKPKSKPKAKPKAKKE